MAHTVDRRWWADYRKHLEASFKQDRVLIRAFDVTLRAAACVENDLMEQVPPLGHRPKQCADLRSTAFDYAEKVRPRFLSLRQKALETKARQLETASQINQWIIIAGPCATNIGGRLAKNISQQEPSLVLIACRMRQRSFMIEHRAQIAHVDPAAAFLAPDVMLALVRRRAVGGISIITDPPAGP